MSGEAILSAEIVENLWAVRASPRTPLGELTALPRLLAGGEGVAAPPQGPHPAVGLRPLGLAASVNGHRHALAAAAAAAAAAVRCGREEVFCPAEPDGRSLSVSTYKSVVVRRGSQVSADII